MKALTKLFYLSVFIFFAITSKPLRLTGFYSQERFLTVAKEVGVKLSSDKAVSIMGKINRKVVELKRFGKNQETFDANRAVAASLTDEVNELVGALVIENKNSFMYRCFARFT